MTMSDADIQVKEKTIQILKEPGKWAVIYMNDEKTPMDFVIQSLIKHFSYNNEQATKMTETIHTEGKGVVALYNFEIAEQKATEVKVDAVQHGFPLDVKVENA